MSYFPCDEGLYKKKYLNNSDCGIISGMELIIDDVIPNYLDNNEIDCNDSEVLDSILDEIRNDYVKNPEDEKLLDRIIESDDTITLSKAELTKLLSLFQNYTADEIEFWVEMERGEALVGFIDDTYMSKSDKEMAPIWEEAEKDEYTGIDPEKDDNFTYNANGKPRPVWSYDNSWQNKNASKPEAKNNKGVTH